MSGFAMFLIGISILVALVFAAPGVKMVQGVLENDLDVNGSGLFGAFVISFVLLFVLPWLVLGYWAFCWAVALGIYLYKQGKQALKQLKAEEH